MPIHPIPTEPIGSIPRPPELMQGVKDFESGRISAEQLDALYSQAVRSTIELFEATGRPSSQTASSESRVSPHIRSTGSRTWRRTA